MAAICPIVNTDRLLLATDGSEFSEGAVREAIRIAGACASKLTIVSVIETNPEYEALAPGAMEKTEKEVRAKLEAIQERVRKEGVICDLVIHEGEDSYRYIVDEANKQKITMIIMGRRGRRGFKRLVMGSTTSWTIGHSHCSVLVVPRAAEVGFTNILLATDGSRTSAAAASEAIGIAQRNRSTLTVISVVPSEFLPPTDIELAMSRREMIADRELTEAEKSVRTVKEAAEKAGVTVKAFVMSGKPADAIVETAKEKKSGLIILGSHGRTGLEKLLMGSVAERVIVLSDSAVMVVKT